MSAPTMVFSDTEEGTLPLLDLPEQVIQHIVGLINDHSAYRQLRATCRSLCLITDRVQSSLWLDDEHSTDYGPNNVEVLVQRCKLHGDTGMSGLYPALQCLTVRLEGFNPASALLCTASMGLDRLRSLRSLALTFPSTANTTPDYAPAAPVVDFTTLTRFWASLPSTLTALAIDCCLVPSTGSGSIISQWSAPSLISADALPASWVPMPSSQSHASQSALAFLQLPQAASTSAQAVAAAAGASAASYQPDAHTTLNSPLLQALQSPTPRHQRSNSHQQQQLGLGQLAVSLHSTLPNLQALDLKGGIWLASELDLAALGSLRCLRSVLGARLGCGGGSVQALLACTALERLELRLECSPDFDTSHIPSTCEELLHVLPRMTRLTSLALCEFQAPAAALLGALSGLPHLTHLSLHSLDDYYLSDVHLRLLASFPSLAHLGADRLDVQDESLVLPCLRSLDINLTVLSYPRLSSIFPNVSRLQLRYLWEAAMRKIAGWHSLRSLYLGNLAFCIDWSLLRTLTNLEQLTLARGASYEQLCELLYLLQGLPKLGQLTLSGWQCSRVPGGGIPATTGGSISILSGSAISISGVAAGGMLGSVSIPAQGSSASTSYPVLNAAGAASPMSGIESMLYAGHAGLASRAGAVPSNPVIDSAGASSAIPAEETAAQSSRGNSSGTHSSLECSVPSSPAGGTRADSSDAFLSSSGLLQAQSFQPHIVHAAGAEASSMQDLVFPPHMPPQEAVDTACMQAAGQGDMASTDSCSGSRESELGSTELEQLQEAAIARSLGAVQMYGLLDSLGCLDLNHSGSTMAYMHGIPLEAPESPFQVPQVGSAAADVAHYTLGYGYGADLLLADGPSTARKSERRRSTKLQNGGKAKSNDKGKSGRRSKAVELVNSIPVSSTAGGCITRTAAEPACAADGPSIYSRNDILACGSGGGERGDVPGRVVDSSPARAALQGSASAGSGLSRLHVMSPSSAAASRGSGWTSSDSTDPHRHIVNGGASSTMPAEAAPATATTATPAAIAAPSSMIQLPACDKLPSPRSSGSTYNTSVMAACLDAPLYTAVGRMRANARDAPVLALGMLALLPALHTLVLEDCANALVGALAYSEPLTALRRLTLAKQMDLVASDVAAIINNLPAVTELRVLDCWPVTGGALLATPEIYSRPSLHVLLHGDPPAVHAHASVHVQHERGGVGGAAAGSGGGGGGGDGEGTSAWGLNQSGYHCSPLI